MQFTETHLPGVYVIDLDRHEDDRGWFARAWCREAFAAQGLSVDGPVQSLAQHPPRHFAGHAFSSCPTRRGQDGAMRVRRCA